MMQLSSLYLVPSGKANLVDLLVVYLDSSSKNSKIIICGLLFSYYFFNLTNNCCFHILLQDEMNANSIDLSFK